MFDPELILVELAKIKIAASTTNDICDDVMKMFRNLNQLFTKWGVGVAAEYGEVGGLVLEYKRFGRDAEYRFTARRTDSTQSIAIDSLKRYERIDIIYQLPGLMQNIYTALVEQRASTNNVGDLVSRLKLLLDNDASP